jgi:aarF domain-containing kinase
MHFLYGSDLHPGNVLVRKFYVKREQSKLALLLNFAKTTTNSFTASNDAQETEEVLMLKDDPTMEMKRQIVFLDAGIAFQLDTEAQRNLKDLFRAVVTNEGKEAGRLMVERAKYERCSSVPGGVEAFSNGIGEIVSEFHDRRKDGLTLGAVRIGSLLMRVLDLCRLHGVEIDPAMASVIISTLVLEGLGRSLEPSLNLIDFAIPFVLGRGRI